MSDSSSSFLLPLFFHGSSYIPAGYKHYDERLSEQTHFGATPDFVLKKSFWELESGSQSMKFLFLDLSK